MLAATVSIIRNLAAEKKTTALTVAEAVEEVVRACQSPVQPRQKCFSSGVAEVMFGRGKQSGGGKISGLSFSQYFAKRTGACRGAGLFLQREF